MTCPDCEKIQNGEKRFGDVYIRVGNSNVLIVACEKHCKELINKLTKANK